MRSIRPSALAAALFCATIALRAESAAPPAPAHGLEDVLRQTSAVVSGRVASVSFRYDEIEGPRTVAILDTLTVHVGSLGHSSRTSIELRSFGGFLPDGREVTATHVPRLAEGERYLVFLRSTEWSLSPIAFELAFRVATAFSEEVLVDPYGRLVVGLSTRGVMRGPSLFARSDGGLDTHAPELVSTSIAPTDVERAMGPSELVAALRFFSEATGVGPSGTFFEAPALRVPGPSWRRVATSLEPAPVSVPPYVHDALACFGPSDGLEDQSREEIAMCVDGGAP